MKNKFSYKTTVVIILLVLLVVNIAALSTIIYKNKHSHPKFPPPQNEDFFQGPGHFRDFMLKDLGLSDEQFEEFRMQGRDFFKSSRESMEKMRINKENLFLEISKENPDTVVLNRITNQMGQDYAALKRASIAHFFEIKKILTPDQQQKFFERMKNENMHFGPGSGHGNFEGPPHSKHGGRK
ncbi:Spy/CpxP family protein refolding chaperone [Bacteroidota bacterium]